LGIGEIKALREAIGVRWRRERHAGTAEPLLTVATSGQRKDLEAALAHKDRELTREGWL